MVIFSKKGGDAKSVAKNMYEVLTNNQPHQLKMTPEEFGQVFDLATWDQAVVRGKRILEAKLSLLERQWTAYCEDIRTENTTIEKSKRSTVLSQNIIQMSDECAKLNEWFWKTYEDKVTDDNLWAIQQDISMLIFNRMTKIRLKMLEVMRILQDQKLGFMDEDTMLRKCPYCDTVWYKSSGCIGKTECGRREYGFVEKEGWDGSLTYVIDFCKSVVKYFTDGNVDDKLLSANFANNKEALKYTIQTKDTGFGRATGNGQKAAKYVAKKQESLAGCGRTIVWSEMPMLDPMELQQLYQTNPDLKDFLKAKVQGEGFQRLRDKEAAIDKAWK